MASSRQGEAVEPQKDVDRLDEPRVLVVDDDAILATAIQRLLGTCGFVVDVALNGPTAIERLRQGRYEVMLLDLQMANMDGREIFRFAQQLPSAPFTVLHSAYIDVQTAVSAVRSGLHDVMQKPVPEESLVARIRELANAQRALTAKGTALAGRGRDTPTALERLVGESAGMQELRDQIQRVARFRDLSVLIQGQTGTGKELVAAAIHALSCPSEPFVCVNCAAIPEHLFESELFGHEAGSFTNAKSSRVGLFEEAGRGVIFLDEIGELPLSVQAKLLRVLETRQFRRVGANRGRLLAARIVSATNRSLIDEFGVRIRADLYFRLAGYTLVTPSLSQHMTDLSTLARHFLRDFTRRHAMVGVELSPEALAELDGHTWPGNVRELRSVIENACILARAERIGRNEIVAALHTRTSGASPSSASWAIAAPPAPSPPSLAAPGLARGLPFVEPRSTVPKSLPDLERELMLKAFHESGGNLTRAAQELGIARSTLRDRLRRYGVMLRGGPTKSKLPLV